MFLKEDALEFTGQSKIEELVKRFLVNLRKVVKIYAMRLDILSSSLSLSTSTARLRRLQRLAHHQMMKMTTRKILKKISLLMILKLKKRKTRKKRKRLKK